MPPVKSPLKETRIRIQTAAVPEAAPLAEISAIRDTAEQRKYERLLRPGYFDLGFALARGNARTETLTTAFTAACVTRTDKTILRFHLAAG